MITILPIIDRRVVVPRNGLITLSDNIILNNKEEVFIDEYSMNISSLVQVDSTIYTGYCNSLSKEINADYVEILKLDSLGINNEDINFLLNLVKNDKENTSFYFSEIIPVGLPMPQAFTFCNIKDTDLFCVVRDKDESHFSLPGGTCELWETGEEGAIRETKEEAQLNIKNLKLLGCNIGNVKNEKGDILNTFCQPRYYAQIDKDDIKDFIPELDGFEIEERKFVSLQELPKYITWLEKSNGLPYLEKLNEITNNISNLAQ